MISDERMEAAIRSAIKDASGKKMSDAVYIFKNMVKGLLEDDTFTILPGIDKDPAPMPTPMPPPMEPIKRIEELKPVGHNAAKYSDQSRVRRSVGDIQTILAEKAPPYINVIPEGSEAEINLRKSIRIEGGDGYQGVQLCYQPPNMESGVPYPKVTFWCNEEDMDIDGAVEKMRQEAALMYRVRKTPIVTSVKAMPPLETRFAAKEQV